MKSVKQKALEHYDKMIAWVEIRKLTDLVNQDYMYAGINQIWNANFCPYCKSMTKRSWNAKNKWKCPLAFDEDNECQDADNCCKGLWRKMDDAKTWKTWLKYAKLVREYIKENG